jgi:hypothetical protein
MPTMYEAATSNYREVEKALTQLERSITSALRRNDVTSVRALSLVQLLLVSVKAEARLTKIAYTPRGLSQSERADLLSTDDTLERWKVAVDSAFRRHYHVPAPVPLADNLDHDSLAKRSTLYGLMDNELRLVISLRNKLAHGHWAFPLNARLTAVDPSTVAALSSETTLSLRFRDRLLVQLGNIVVDLVVSAPSFDARFNMYFVKIRKYRNLLVSARYDDWCKSVRATKAPLARVAPTVTPAIEL